jgi:hypothetical protein
MPTLLRSSPNEPSSEGRTGGGIERIEFKIFPDGRLRSDECVYLFTISYEATGRQLSLITFLPCNIPTQTEVFLNLTRSL